MLTVIQSQAMQWEDDQENKGISYSAEKKVAVMRNDILDQPISGFAETM